MTHARFESDAVLDAATNAFVFFGCADGEPIRCAITHEAVTAGLHVPPEAACDPETFVAHQRLIHRIAARLIDEKRWEPGGGIVIREADLT